MLPSNHVIFRELYCSMCLQKLEAKPHNHVSPKPSPPARLARRTLDSSLALAAIRSAICTSGAGSELSETFRTLELTAQLLLLSTLRTAYVQSSGWAAWSLWGLKASTLGASCEQTNGFKVAQECAIGSDESSRSACSLSVKWTACRQKKLPPKRTISRRSLL